MRAAKPPRRALARSPAPHHSQDQQAEHAGHRGARRPHAAVRAQNRNLVMRRRRRERELLGREHVVWLGDPGRILGEDHRGMSDARIRSRERELLGGEHVVRCRGIGPITRLGGFAMQ